MDIVSIRYNRISDEGAELIADYLTVKFYLFIE
jgi:hypothetical protein